MTQVVSRQSPGLVLETGQNIYATLLHARAFGPGGSSYMDAPCGYYICLPLPLSNAITITSVTAVMNASINDLFAFENIASVMGAL